RFALRVAAVLSAAAIMGCTTNPYPPAPQIAASPDYLYKIGPGDSVQINVWRNPEISASVPVRPDGKLTAPLIEDLPAMGKDPTKRGDITANVDVKPGDILLIPQSWF